MHVDEIGLGFNVKSVGGTQLFWLDVMLLFPLICLTLKQVLSTAHPLVHTLLVLVRNIFVAAERLRHTSGHQQLKYFSFCMSSCAGCLLDTAGLLWSTSQVNVNSCNKINVISLTTVTVFVLNFNFSKTLNVAFSTQQYNRTNHFLLF